MITALAARWVLTAVFAAAGLTATLPWRAPAESAQPAERISAVFCGAMCAALIAMIWRSEPAAATWPQAALFGCAALWFGLSSLAGSGRGWRPSLPAPFHTLMGGRHDLDAHDDARRYGQAGDRGGPRRHGVHVPGRHARPGARGQHPVRGVPRGRIAHALPGWQ